MNTRERFIAQMHYQPRDRSLIWDFNFWRETIAVWHEQGLPPQIKHDYSGVTTDAFFGMDPTAHWTGHSGLCPAFEEKVIEDRGDHEVIQQGTGTTVLRKKFMSSIPMHLGHTLVDRESWKKHYLPRLDPDHPGRFNLQRVREQDAREEVLLLSGGSLYGNLRDWMGMENLSMVVYDDPAWFEEMVVAQADCTVGVIQKAIEHGIQPDACGIWEDMCYNAGPLLSPKHFMQYLVPQYRRITDLLHKINVDVVWVDCDGCIDQLVPLWLEAGVNCMFPVEVGTWGGDPIKFRKQYGRELLLVGGFDKRILMRGPAAIDAEVQRLTPLVEEGGYIPLPDHRVPPDVPYAHYVHYLKQARKVWGKDTNLRPMHPSIA
ncbi:MAG: hypothetical protein IT441_01595 [Phycisphaeraceae bacterium]|nr:hypothetical protein [Phycisphaeraceae bacterium]